MTSAPRDLIADAIAMLRTLDARIVVAATAHNLREFEDDRVLVEGLLPSHAIMPRVDLAVITGGQGSVQTALASGVPFIGVPLQPEQDANVVFAERQGAARRLSRIAARTPALTQTARAIVADDRYRRAARRIQALFAVQDGPGAAAAAIIELASEGSNNLASASRSAATCEEESF
jgi:UDP:flavonoid glycosyltransferase YjiC (YdhE family)